MEEQATSNLIREMGRREILREREGVEYKRWEEVVREYNR